MERAICLTEGINNMENDLINRRDAIDAICKACSLVGDYHKCDGYPETSTWCEYLVALRALPSAQPDYQEVLGWLLAYHTKSFDLHGRYLPHEVISWLINDFTKAFIAEREHDG